LSIRHHILKMLKYIDKNNGSLHNKRKQVSMYKVGFLMKKIEKALIFVFILSNLYAAEYQATEMFVLPWGNENDQEIPIVFDEHGDPWGPSGYFVDNSENIYISTFYFGFRKYDNQGKTIFSNNSDVAYFAVDDSEQVYFTTKKITEGNVICTMDKYGEARDTFLFKIGPIGIRINKIKYIRGKIYIRGFAEKPGSQTAYISNNNLTVLNKKQYIPFNSDSVYFFAETQTTSVTEIKRKESFNKKFINLFKLYTDENGEIIKEKYRVDGICRFPHVRAKVIGIDDRDNLYIYIKYGRQMPIDVAIIDRNLNFIAQIEMIPLSQTRGLWSRPFVRSDGNIYEFRDLEDGLHIIRWSREE